MIAIPLLAQETFPDERFWVVLVGLGLGFISMGIFVADDYGSDVRERLDAGADEDDLLVRARKGHVRMGRWWIVPIGAVMLVAGIVSGIGQLLG